MRSRDLFRDQSCTSHPLTLSLNGIRASNAIFRVLWTRITFLSLSVSLLYFNSSSLTFCISVTCRPDRYMVSLFFLFPFECTRYFLSGWEFFYHGYLSVSVQGRCKGSHIKHLKKVCTNRASNAMNNSPMNYLFTGSLQHLLVG